MFDGNNTINTDSFTSLVIDTSKWGYARAGYYNYVD